MSDASSAAAEAPGPIETPVQYTNGLLGKQNKGILKYDGTGSVTLINEDGTTRFSKTMAELGKVRRAEFCLYFKIDGKTVSIVFGDPRKYMLKDAARSQGGQLLGAAGGVAGAYAAQKGSHQANIKSGLESWVDVLRAGGAMGLNASPQGIWQNWFVKPMKWIGIVGGGLIVVALIVTALG